jgi:hypothetical protein
MCAALIKQNLKKLIDQTRNDWHDLLDSDDVDQAFGFAPHHGRQTAHPRADSEPNEAHRSPHRPRGSHVHPSESS